VQPLTFVDVGLSLGAVEYICWRSGGTALGWGCPVRNPAGEYRSAAALPRSHSMAIAAHNTS